MNDQEILAVLSLVALLFGATSMGLWFLHSEDPFLPMDAEWKCSLWEIVEDPCPLSVLPSTPGGGCFAGPPTVCLSYVRIVEELPSIIPLDWRVSCVEETLVRLKKKVIVPGASS